MKIINDQLEKVANNRLREKGLTLAQIRVIHFLLEREHQGIQTTQKDVEVFLGVTHPTVIGIVRRLERNGFIKTGYDSKDGRLKNLYLTPPKEMAEGDPYDPKEVERQLTKGMTPEQLEALRGYLQIIYKNILEFQGISE